MLSSPWVNRVQEQNTSCWSPHTHSHSIQQCHLILICPLSMGQWMILCPKFSSVTQSCPTICDLMNCSTPGLPAHHQLLEFTQTLVHRVGDAEASFSSISAISSSVVPFSSCPQSLPASVSFPISQLFPWGGQSTGVSASASVLSMKTQDWSPLEWTGWISLQSKGLSRVFSNTTVQNRQFFGAQLS